MMVIAADPPVAWSHRSWIRKNSSRTVDTFRQRDCDCNVHVFFMRNCIGKKFLDMEQFYGLILWNNLSMWHRLVDQYWYKLVKRERERGIILAWEKTTRTELLVTCEQVCASFSMSLSLSSRSEFEVLELLSLSFRIEFYTWLPLSLALDILLSWIQFRTISIRSNIRDIETAVKISYFITIQLLNTQKKFCRKQVVILILQ